MPELQSLCDSQGGAREKQAPIAIVESEGCNIIDLYSADRVHLAAVAWRPFENGLFICG